MSVDRIEEALEQTMTGIRPNSAFRSGLKAQLLATARARLSDPPPVQAVRPEALRPVVRRSPGRLLALWSGAAAAVVIGALSINAWLRGTDNAELARFGTLPPLTAGLAATEPQTGGDIGIMGVGGEPEPPDIKYELAGSLPKVAAQQPVWQLSAADVTAEQVRQVARAVGVDAPVMRDELADRTVYRAGEEPGPLVVGTSLGHLEFRSGVAPEPVPTGSLPPDAEAVRIAEDWLSRAGLAREELGAPEVRIVGRRGDEAEAKMVVYRAGLPQRALFDGGTARVSLGSGGTVLSFGADWVRIAGESRYPVRTAEVAWNTVRAGNGIVVAADDERELQPQELAGLGRSVRIHVRAVKFAYLVTAGSGGRAYLQPVYAFEAEAAGELGSRDVIVLSHAVTDAYVEAGTSR